MIVDLMAEMPAGEQYAEAARGWLEGVLEELFPELREGLRTRPSTRKISMHWDNGPEGEPGQVRGEIEVGMTDWRTRTTVFTEASWQRFLDSLGKSPATAALGIRVIGHDGYLSDNVAYLRVVRPEEEPGWARFTFQSLAWLTGEPGLADSPRPGGTAGGGRAGPAELQGRWVDAVKRQAERIGAYVGMITSRGGGPAPHETVTYPDWPPEMVLQPPEYVQEVAMLGASREVLYRYAWVTIIPPEIAARLGNARGLAASGAFHEVSELATGSVWLRATRSLKEFDQSRSAAVAAALAPVLVAATTL